MEAQTDLFGHPLEIPRRPPGRPRHAPTSELRAEVQRLHALGQSHLEIAAAIGVTDPTLRLHYHKELNSRSQTWRRHVINEGGTNAS